MQLFANSISTLLNRYYTYIQDLLVVQASRHTYISKFIMESLRKAMCKISNCYRHLNVSHPKYASSFELSKSKQLSTFGIGMFGRNIHASHSIQALCSKSKIDPNFLLSMVSKEERRTNGNQELSKTPTQSPSYIQTLVETASRNTAKDNLINWEEVAIKAITSNPFVDRKNFGGILLKTCEKLNSFDVAKSYFTWIKEPNLAQLASFMRICGDNMDKVKEGEVIAMYKKIKAKIGGIWEYELANKVVYTLERTSQWKEALQIMELVQLNSKEHLTSEMSVVSAAFKNNAFDLGWSILHKSCNNPIPHEVFSEWLRLCPKTEVSFERLIKFCDTTEIYASEMLVNDISSYLETHLNYNRGKKATINFKNGVCQNCQQALLRKELTAEEFKTLRDYLFHIVASEDTFFHSTPQELKRFIQFICQNGPFDYVLDALSIAHSSNIVKPKGRHLVRLASKYASQGKRVLIIGRKHISKWPRDILEQLREYGYLFLIDNKSKNDLFIIYATLKSGSGTMYVSNDFMRNYIYRLKNAANISRLFKIWRLTHQLNPVYDYHTKDLTLLPLSPLLPVPQKDCKSGIWHMPYDTDVIHSPYKLPSFWMCFTPKR